jgi:hypothetical protein
MGCQPSLDDLEPGDERRSPIRHWAQAAAPGGMRIPRP